MNSERREKCGFELMSTTNTLDQATGQFRVAPVPETLVVQVDIRRALVPGAGVTESADGMHS
jgi:hypothetical protein